MGRKILLVTLVVLLVYAIVRQPTEAGTTVNQLFNAVIAGAGVVVDAFFRFVNALFV